MRRSITSALAAGALLPVFAKFALASPNDAFDRACGAYYRQNLDPDVPPPQADAFCSCLADELEAAGLGSDALDFFARTYSDDLTTFIHEYPEGEFWMEKSLDADAACKAATKN